jgi:uncharacterized protein
LGSETTEKLAAPVKVGDVTLSQAITTVTWTATGAGVPANDFDEFALSVGRLPERVDSLSFPAVQTYSDGEVVQWVDGSEAEHPAPALKLTTAVTPVAASSSSSSSSEDSSDPLARGLGGAGLLLGLIGLGLGLRSRKPAGAGTSESGKAQS